MKKEWEAILRSYNSCSPPEHHTILFELKYAYNALLFSQNDYDIGDPIHEYWGTSFIPETNEYEYKPHITPMAYITSIPI